MCRWSSIRTRSSAHWMSFSRASQRVDNLPPSSAYGVVRIVVAAAMRTDRDAHRDWLELADGRRMAFTATGPADGLPVIYCHGAIGTPLSASVDLERLSERLECATTRRAARRGRLDRAGRPVRARFRA